jgi:hypothetical protein
LFVIALDSMRPFLVLAECEMIEPDIQEKKSPEKIQVRTFPPKHMEESLLVAIVPVMVEYVVDYKKFAEQGKQQANWFVTRRIQHTL